jgi:hypothetical protein
MPFINDTAFDQALNYIKNGVDRLDITSQEATTPTEARTTYTLGNKSITSANTTGPQAGDVDGRELQINAITDGSVTGTGTANSWALSNSTVLLATGALSTGQSVTTGNQFTLGIFDITIRDAT